jgi:hypothetical protein
MVSDVVTADAGCGRQNLTDADADGVKPREGKVVRPDGKSQDARAATAE